LSSRCWISLGRNDVGGGAQIDTVKVTDQLFVERYSQVMHIVSNVEGKLRHDRNSIDAIVPRTALIKDGIMYVQAGIVADSDPGFEQQECINKARPCSAPPK
jgi:anthranilate synthase component 1